MQKFLFVLLIYCAMGTNSYSFSQESVKGNWTNSDKYQLIADLNSQRGVFESFLDSTQIDPMIDCIASQIEEQYENPQAVDVNSPNLEQISITCLDQVGFSADPPQTKNTSVKGNWSQSDIDAAYQNLEYTRSVMQNVIDSSKLDLLFNCVVDKLESNYKNFEAAANDPGDGISNVTFECIEENNLIDELDSIEENTMIQESKGDPNSSAGNWSEADKNSLIEQLEAIRPSFEKKLGKEGTKVAFECILFNFEFAFENYEDINNHPELYKAILDECYEKQLE